MARTQDLRVDDFRDNEGNLFGLTPTHGWVKPRTVVLHSKTFRNTLEGTLPNGSELEFAVPWSAPTSHAIKPGKGILESFLQMATMSEAEIHRFASRFGPLFVCSRVEERPDEGLIFESCDVWRYFSASMTALLQIAGDIHLGQPCASAKWQPIGNVPPLLCAKKNLAIDWINPSAADGEKEWVLLAVASQLKTNRHPTVWAGLLNALLLLGRVRTFVELGGRRGAQRPRLAFSGSSLLSFLALQVSLLASRHDAFALCSYCNSTFTPGKRAPKSGQRSFCPACRADGAPVRVAQRARRARLSRKT
jgi:hypothetical protein